MNKINYLILTTIVTILLGIAVLTVGVKHQSANTFPPVYGKNFNIIASDYNICPNNYHGINNISSYRGYFSVTNNFNYPQTIHVIVDRYFCPGNVNDCEQNDQPIDHGYVTFSGNQTIQFDIPSYSGNLVCGQQGTYQADIEFVGFNNYKFQSAIWCDATLACTPTPTPTTPTPTPTVPVTPTPTVPTVTPTPTISITPIPTCIPVPPCVYAKPFHCEIAINQGYCPIPVTPTPTVPTVTPTPTVECPSGYVLQIVNSIMFCMEQSQSQSQSQSTVINNVNNNNNSSNNSSNNTNNNSSNSNPDINIGLTSYSGNNPATIVYPSNNSTHLPSTGTPWQDLATIGFAPIGYIVKKITDKLG